MTIRGCILAALLACASAAPAAAQTVYDGGGPTGWIGTDMWADILPADDFASTGMDFDGIRFWGLTFDAAAVSGGTEVFWQILADDGGAPGTVVADGAGLATGTQRRSFGGYESWQFDLDVGPRSLGSGVFWLALNAPFSDLLWEGSDGGRGDGFASALTWDQTVWGDHSYAGNLAFELTRSTVAVPEPATLLLMGSGLFGIGAIGMRRRRHTHALHV